MERLKRVAGVWSWLPAFRAVAETQHLPTASAQLEVSASALSRTIRLLENDLGRTLFERQGRRIVLNEAGERLLVAVRDAMRRVHDGMSVMDSTELEGALLVATCDDVASLVGTHALAALADRSPGLIPQVRQLGDEHIVEALLTGSTDVAFTSAPLEDPGVTRTRLGQVPMAVYAPADVSVRRVADHPFVLWGQRSDGTTRDGWPSSLTRNAAASVSDLHAATRLASRIGGLVVLPEAYARPAVDRGELVSLRSKVQPMQVYAFHRHSLLPGGRAETLVELASSAIAGGLQ